MKKHYFTFGIGHVYAGYYLIINAADETAARNEMIRKFGAKWAFQYSEKEWYEEGKALHEIYDWKLWEEKENDK